MQTRVSTPKKEVFIGDAQPTVLIGERINPAGKKKLAEALKAGDLEVVCSEALAQVQAGADILDVNVGAFGVDEVDMLPRAVQAVMDAVDVPLCIDSNNLEALEAAMKIYKGKPLINSITGEENSLTRILPLVKEHGAAVIGLVQDDEGIPKDAKRRVTIARNIVKCAGAFGIGPEDIVIDCLAFAVGADTSSGQAVMEAIQMIKLELGVNMTLGASNISFGLPDRDLLNSAFAAMAIAAGVTCLITYAAKIKPSIAAADLILGRDKHARRYIDVYRQHRKQ